MKKETSHITKFNGIVHIFLLENILSVCISRSKYIKYAVVTLCLAAMFHPAFGQNVKLDSVANVADGKCDSVFKERNPYGKGTIFDVNGNEIYAIVGLSLFGEKQEDGTVIELETPVKLYCLADEKLLHSFKLKDVRKVIVNNTVYVPVTILSSTRLMELVYEKGNFQLFYEADKSNYCIRLIEQDKAYYVDDLLKAGQSSE